MLFKETFFLIRLTVTRDLQTSFKVTPYPLIKGTIWMKYRSEQMEIIHDPEKDFSFKSGPTFTFDLENGFKVITYPLLISYVYVKYEPNRLKWKIYMLCKRILGWSDMIVTLALQTFFKGTALLRL